MWSEPNLQAAVDGMGNADAIELEGKNFCRLVLDLRRTKEQDLQSLGHSLRMYGFAQGTQKKYFAERGTGSSNDSVPFLTITERAMYMTALATSFVLRLSNPALIVVVTFHY